VRLEFSLTAQSIVLYYKAVGDAEFRSVWQIAAKLSTEQWIYALDQGSLEQVQRARQLDNGQVCRWIVTMTVGGPLYARGDFFCLLYNGLTLALCQEWPGGCMQQVAVLKGYARRAVLRCECVLLYACQDGSVASVGLCQDEGEFGLRIAGYVQLRDMQVCIE
jgi:hypothetical protein